MRNYFLRYNIRIFKYSFTTTFTIQASRDAVWKVLIDFRNWSTWWKGIRKISVNNSTNPSVLNVGIGYTFYVLNLIFQIQHVEKNKELAINTTGDLVGTGVFTLIPNDGITVVKFSWNVVTTKKWMNITAPVARPFFVYSHNLVMKWFVKGLSKKMGASIVKAEYK